MADDSTSTQEGIAAAYAAARESCLVVQHETPGLLRLRGANTLDFLHRMSTNDMTGLESGAMRGTVLTTAIGRIVDVVHALRRPTEVVLLTTPGRQAAVREWLGRYIFFNDDVRIEPVAEPFSFFGVYGPKSASAAEKLGAPPLTAPGEFSEVGDGLMWETALPIPGFRLLAGIETDARARALWGECSFGAASLPAYEALRIEGGLPAVGREIVEDVIPLEVGLWDLVSFAKGCYIGQEVIARMESRSRVTRSLVGVRLSRLEETPQEILLAGQPIGRLTSVAFSPKLGPIGLALVRTSALDGHGDVIRLAPSGREASLQSLPFDRASS